MEIENWNEFTVYAYDKDEKIFEYDRYYFSEEDAIERAKSYKHSYVVAIYCYNKPREVIFTKNCTTFASDDRYDYFDAIIITRPPSLIKKISEWVSSLVKI